MRIEREDKELNSSVLTPLPPFVIFSTNLFDCSATSSSRN